MYHPFLEANKVYLRGIEKKDLEGKFFQWANDKEVTHFLFMGSFPNILENLYDWFEQMRRSNEDVVFMIIDKAKDRELGFCGFHQIRWIHRSAEYRIFIGEKEKWGKGIGEEVTKIMLRYGFEILNFNKIWLGVNASHKRAVNLYKKCGFIEEGVLREEIYKNSKYYDAVRMSILRKEYYQNFKKEWDRQIPNIFERE